MKSSHVAKVSSMRFHWTHPDWIWQYISSIMAHSSYLEEAAIDFIRLKSRFRPQSTFIRIIWLTFNSPKIESYWEMWWLIARLIRLVNKLRNNSKSNKFQWKTIWPAATAWLVCLFILWMESVWKFKWHQRFFFFCSDENISSSDFSKFLRRWGYHGWTNGDTKIKSTHVVHCEAKIFTFGNGCVWYFCFQLLF